MRKAVKQLSVGDVVEGHAGPLHVVDITPGALPGWFMIKWRGGGWSQMRESDQFEVSNAQGDDRASLAWNRSMGYVWHRGQRILGHRRNNRLSL